MVVRWMFCDMLASYTVRECYERRVMTLNARGSTLAAEAVGKGGDSAEWATVPAAA